MNPGISIGVPQNFQLQPARVQAAFQALSFIEYKENPPPGCDGIRQESRDLTREEKAMKSAAMEVITLYLRSEMDFGDVPPIPPAGGDDPRQPQPVTV